MFGNSSRLDKIESRLAALESGFKALQLDWNVVYDKVRKSLSRAVMTWRKIDDKERTEEEGTEAPLTSPGGDGVHGPFLNRRQREIQQQILRRRAGG